MGQYSDGHVFYSDMPCPVLPGQLRGGVEPAPGPEEGGGGGRVPEPCQQEDSCRGGKQMRDGWQICLKDQRLHGWLVGWLVIPTWYGEFCVGWSTCARLVGTGNN